MDRKTTKKDPCKCENTNEAQISGGGDGSKWIEQVSNELKWIGIKWIAQI